MPPGARKTNTTKLLLCATLLKCYSQVVSFISHSASIMTPQCKESYLLSSFYHYSYSFFFFKPRFIELPLHDAIFFFKFYLILFIYFCLCWVVSVRGLSLVAASGGHSSSRCAGLTLSRPLLLRSTGSRRTGSVVVAHGPSCSVACGIFPDQGLNPCPLH